VALRRQQLASHGPYRDASDGAEKLVGHLDHSDSIAERPPASYAFSAVDKVRIRVTPSDAATPVFVGLARPGVRRVRGRR
jgi:hypothetical protein